MEQRLATRLILALALLLGGGEVLAGSPRISIIIDDLGDRHAEGSRAIELPGAVSYAFLPHTPYSRELAERAHRHGREVMLHLPMESEQPTRLGPGGLTLHMTEGAFRETVRRDLEAIPYVHGVNNHMGSLLTRHPGHMAWLMDELKSHGELFFIDSRTTTQSVAPQIAGERGIPTAERKVFLDHDPAPEAVRLQFKRLLRRARLEGSAIAIGHPYPATLQVLEEMLPQLESMGIELVAVSTLISTGDGDPTTWQASLSH